MAKVTVNYKGEMLFESRLGNHNILIDVPYEMGGEDRGPTPPQLFVVALGSCIGAFVAQYCELSEIDDRELSVDISFDKVENPTRLTNLKVEVNLPHADCQYRKQAMQQVAEHSPVPETISTLTGIEIKINGNGQAA